MTGTGRIVMTGGSSGLGRHAAETLAAARARLIVGARGTAPLPEGVRRLPLDLAELDSVRRFAGAVRAECWPHGIDALVLNAGGSFPMGTTSAGFETNFAVNHLAHYLLLRLLLPEMAEGGRIVITTSGTHDPASGAAIPPPLHADAARLARPETDPDRDPVPRRATGRAYSAAKLANLLTAQALARRADLAERGITVIAYAPGPTPGTGLVSARGPVMTFVWRGLLPLAARLSRGLNTPAAAGRALADLALGRAPCPEGRIYALLRKDGIDWPDPSALARDPAAIRAMWEDSAALLAFDETEETPPP